MASVKTYDSIQVGKFNYNKPTKYNNSYFGPLSYDTNTEPIYIQTPQMKCPYGLSRFETDNGRFKYSLDLSFGNKESNLINNLKTFLEKIDEAPLEQ